jgi:P-type Cu+ transporter
LKLSFRINFFSLEHEYKIAEKVVCYHCGEICQEDNLHFIDDKNFCCSGCQTVFEILQENNLCSYYDLNQNAGISLKAKNFEDKFAYLDEPELITQLLDYQSNNICKVTFYIPAVHCSSCVWLLENFHKVRSGVLTSRLNFLKKELSLSYNQEKISLRAIVELLATLGYEPSISLENVVKEDYNQKQSIQRNLLVKIGVVGFCLGNIMMMSFPEYLHLDLQNKVDATYQRFFLYFNTLLSLPVFFFGASDYLRGAWISIREYFKKTSTVFSVDIPIAIGIIALFLRSLFETFINHSAGYFDSLAGLVFFLLLGKWIQQVTFNYLSFERNYTSYFPLAVKTLQDGIEHFVNVSALKKGDIIFIHSQELIPADSIIIKNTGLVDYSFVTGESERILRNVGDLVFAGGRQFGEILILEVQKPVSQSYLTQLWNNDAFNKEKPMPTTDLANAFSQYFTLVVLIIATATGCYWYFVDYSNFWNATTAVLMVACPCALTLSMPFTMGSTMAIFGRNKFYVKNQGVIQLLNEITGIAFDKTGTLTETKAEKIHWIGKELNQKQKIYIREICNLSVHPLSRMIVNFFDKVEAFDSNLKIEKFKEHTGKGIEAICNGLKVRIGNKSFIQNNYNEILHTHTFLEIDGNVLGYFIIESTYRNNWKTILNKLSKNFKLFLLSGDTAAEREKLLPFFSNQQVYFNKKPQDKLNFIKAEQSKGEKILMIGDGLNDSGALRQSHVGIAISEDIKVFSPASDALLDASEFDKLVDFISFSKTAIKIVKTSFLLSLVYNFIGLSWAISGQLLPVTAAIFMPLSSISVVLFAVGLTYFFAWKKGF